MLKTRVIPCLLLKDGSIVKTVRFKKVNYIGDPVNTIRIFNQMEVDEIVFLDITATTENRKPDFELIENMAGECFMPLAYGGGIRSTDDIKTILSLGVEKVVVNTFSTECPSFVKEASDLFGSQSIIVSIDARGNLFDGYEIYNHGGRVNTGLDPVTFAKEAERLGAGEILLTSIERDGTWNGYDIKLIKRVNDVVNIPLIACGGAGKVEDFRDAVKRGGASAVAAGSMFVYHMKDLGVLINFPKKDELEKVLS